MAHRWIGVTFALSTLAVAAALHPTPLRAQAPPRAEAPLDRIVGPGARGAPLVFDKLEPRAIGQLSSAAGVPIGLETAWDAPPEAVACVQPVTVTGLTLREALRLLVSCDPRFDWRDLDGVIVIRPHTLWSGAPDPLQREVDRIYLRRTRAEEVIGMAANLLGASGEIHMGLEDTRDFPVDFAGGTMLDLLNTIARTHGRLAWALTGCEVPTRLAEGCHFSLWVLINNSAIVSGLTGGAPLLSTDTSWADLDARSPKRPKVPPLERIVKAAPGAVYVTVHGFTDFDLRLLAYAANVPIGIEYLASRRLDAVGVDVTGRTVEQILNEMTRIDPRYEWRVIDGVIVVRPVESWAYSSMPLDTALDAQRFEGTVSAALTRLRSLAGEEPMDYGPGSDTRQFIVDTPPGTLLNLLNAIVLAHGELMWTVKPADARRRGGQYLIALSSVMGTGDGVYW